MASDWLAALLAANQKLHLKIAVSYPCFKPRIVLVAITPGIFIFHNSSVIHEVESTKDMCDNTTLLQNSLCEVAANFTSIYVNVFLKPQFHLITGAHNSTPEGWAV